MPPYADIDELIADYIPEAKSDKEKAAVGRILDSVSAFVDSYLKRADGYFTASPAQPSMKRVRGEGKHFLRLPVHVLGSITEVTANSGSVINSNAYYESDKNGWLYADENLVAESIFDSCSSNVWADGQIFKVTARWGYAATPLPIVEAVRLIVARIYSVQKGTIGQTTSEGFIQERLIPQAAKDLLKPFIKREFEI
jgi:hypothetical protein